MIQTYGVRDNEDVSLRSVVGGGLGEVSHDGSVRVEEIWLRQI